MANGDISISKSTVKEFACHLFVPVLLVFVGFRGLPANAQPTPERPNVVFILADDLGYKDLGIYGNPFNETPRIDSLARSGMRFTETYVASPICSPSRAAIMTGRHPARLHLTNFLVGLRTDPNSPLLPAPYQHYLSPGERTMAEFFRDEGYRTGIVGKWHLGNADSVSAAAQGFEYDRIIGRNGLDYYNYSIMSRGETVFEDDGRAYLTDRLADYAVEFIEEHRDEPFFLYVPFSAPHVLIVPRGDKLRPYFFKYNRFGGKYNPYYAAMLESLDDGVGRIVDAIDAAGLAENTIIVFTSDNGGLGLDELGPIPTSNDPLRAWKGFVYEGGARVPFIISWPGVIEANSVNEHYITGTDHLPTFMDLLGDRDLPENLDGRSYLITLYHPEAAFDRGPIYWHYPHFSNQTSRPSGAMRLGRYKLVEHFETGAVELYDLSVDISERNDVSAHFPEKTAELHAMLKAWRVDVDATMPPPNPDYPGDR